MCVFLADIYLVALAILYKAFCNLFRLYFDNFMILWHFCVNYPIEIAESIVSINLNRWVDCSFLIFNVKIAPIDLGIIFNEFLYNQAIIALII